MQHKLQDTLLWVTPPNIVFAQVTQAQYENFSLWYNSAYWLLQKHCRRKWFDDLLGSPVSSPKDGAGVETWESNKSPKSH